MPSGEQGMQRLVLPPKREIQKERGISMNWFLDPEDLGFTVLSIVVTVMVGVLANVIGGPHLALLAAGCSVALFGTLLTVTHD